MLPNNFSQDVGEEIILNLKELNERLDKLLEECDEKKS